MENQNVFITLLYMTFQIFHSFLVHYDYQIKINDALFKMNIAYLKVQLFSKITSPGSHISFKVDCCIVLIIPGNKSIECILFNNITHA